MSARRVLVVTLPPYVGGVPAKTKHLVDVLRGRGHAVTVAFYATLSDEPSLVAPSWRIPVGARPRVASRTCFGDVPGLAIGTWLPELEFTYYRPSPLWADVIRRYDRHIATGGTSLVSYPLYAAGVPHLVWCASTMIEDRQDRRAAMPLARRMYDRAILAPVQSAMERRILAGPGHLLVTSEHTIREFAQLGGSRAKMDRLPIPVDAERFRPPMSKPVPGVIGFAGRITDPRKNMPLLLEAFTRARRLRPDLRLRLTGEPNDALRSAVEARGISDVTEFAGVLPAEQLHSFYQDLDVFVIPSHQEGFGIVGIEAMACGVPVVSTRCGGPEDFVVDHQTGFLAASEPDEIAQRILEIVNDRTLRATLSAGARSAAAAGFSPQSFIATIEKASRVVWGEAL